MLFVDDIKATEKNKKKKKEKKKKKSKSQSRSPCREAVKPLTLDQSVARDALPLVQVKSEFPEDTGNRSSGKDAERRLAGHKNDFQVKPENDKRREVGSADSLHRHRRSHSPRGHDRVESHDSRSYPTVDGSRSTYQRLHPEPDEADRPRTMKTEGKHCDRGSLSKHGIQRVSQECDQRDCLEKRRRRSNSFDDSDSHQRSKTDKNSRAVVQSRHYSQHKSVEFQDNRRKGHRRSSLSSNDHLSQTHKCEDCHNRDCSSRNEQRHDGSDHIDGDSHKHRHRSAR